MSDVSDQDRTRRLREEIGRLEEARLRISPGVMGDEPGALEEDERLRGRLMELARELAAAERQEEE